LSTTQDSSFTFFGNTQESFALTNAQSSVVNLPVARAETFALTDANNVTVQFFGAINESIVLNAYAQATGWFIINDDQTANWTPINTQTPQIWTQIGS
jgi:hypothetical protein